MIDYGVTGYADGADFDAAGLTSAGIGSERNSRALAGALQSSPLVDDYLAIYQEFAGKRR